MGCTSSAMKVPNEKKFRRAIKLYEVKEVESMTNLLNRNKCFDTGDSPLTLAAQEGHEAVVEALIEGGADVNKLDRNGKCPLHIATHINDHETVEILLNNKANPNKYDGDNQTPIHIASQRGYKKLVDILLSAGAKADGADDRGAITPLVYAVIHGHSECVEVLLEHGADPYAIDARGKSVLHISVSNSDLSCTKLLLRYIQDQAAFSADGESLVSLACLTGCAEVLQELVQAGCDTRSYGQDEVPPMIAAVAKCSPECVDILISCDIDVDAIDKKGYTPLQIAVMSIADREKELYFCKYFSNVYRQYTRYDPMELHPENATKCAMSLVQAGADVGRVWERFALLFPSPDGITFEQMVMCEVLIQTFGFVSLAYKKLRIFVSNVISIMQGIWLDKAAVLSWSESCMGRSELAGNVSGTQ